MDNHDKEEGIDKPSPPERWVDPIIENEESIREFLDEIQQLYLYDANQARSRLRSFAQESRFKDAFIGIYMALISQEGFFQDVSENYGEGVEEKIKSFSQEYSSLEDEFKKVYSESYYPYYNRLNNYDSSVDQRTHEGNPVVTFTAYSGNTPVLKTQELPSGLLNFSAVVVNHVRKRIENRHSSVTITEEEAEALANESQHIQRHLDDLNELLDELDSLESESLSEKTDSTNESQHE
ncbi:hypothetical protein [Halorussus ruber]|uniref:hypothetical protein n=1 Tax=Halorussus ruber TaxID=1126238 RepID=UPI001092E81B|nr:hypothetical protein [Halorussus ruber]